ncbi:hypothetical protein H4582DRAFT_2058873 [Lactarius indigo]|nr:hypothetical protein H4582DRAFT_2058873 [Lactarius indigo]
MRGDALKKSLFCTVAKPQAQTGRNMNKLHYVGDCNVKMLPGSNSLVAGNNVTGTDQIRKNVSNDLAQDRDLARAPVDVGSVGRYRPLKHEDEDTTGCASKMRLTLASEAAARQIRDTHHK